jgi:hypothetical protein
MAVAVWIYFCVLCSIQLVYVSGFVQYHAVFVTMSL